MKRFMVNTMLKIIWIKINNFNFHLLYFHSTPCGPKASGRNQAHNSTHYILQYQSTKGLKNEKQKIISVTQFVS